MISAHFNIGQVSGSYNIIYSYPILCVKACSIHGMSFPFVAGHHVSYHTNFNKASIGYNLNYAPKIVLAT